jgi:hypothetical protein
MMTMKKITKRKNSWQCLDLAWKIDVGARHYATKLVLTFLAKTVNESCKTYHGYRSISTHTGLTHEAIRKAIVRLRDEFGILTWKRGQGGNQDAPDTNDYTLNLTAMKDLVRRQGIFNVDTGRLLKYEVPPQPSEEGSDGVPPQLKRGTSPIETGYLPNPAKQNTLVEQHSDRSNPLKDPPVNCFAGKGEDENSTQDIHQRPTGRVSVAGAAAQPSENINAETSVRTPQQRLVQLNGLIEKGCDWFVPQRDALVAELAALGQPKQSAGVNGGAL